jgi:hypothetical protein
MCPVTRQQSSARPNIDRNSITQKTATGNAETVNLVVLKLTALVWRQQCTNLGIANVLHMLSFTTSLHEAIDSFKVTSLPTPPAKAI